MERLWVLRAGAEFFRPLTGSSAATLIVFAPLGFLSGVTGAFFKALSLTMAATLARLLGAHGTCRAAAGRCASSISSAGRTRARGGMMGSPAAWRLLAGLFRRPFLLGLAAAALIAVGLFSYRNVQTGFMPNLDEGGFVLDYLTAPGTSLTETEREVGEIETILRHDPAVASFSMRAGAGFGGDIAEFNKGDFVIRLVPLAQRPGIDVVMGRISDAITAQVPGVTFDPHQLIGDEIGDLTGVPQPIEIKLAAADPAAWARRLCAWPRRSARSKGSNSVDNGIIPAGDAIDIRVDPARAAALGLDPAHVAATLQTEMAGTVATQFATAQQLIGVRVRLNGAAQLNSDELATLPIAAPNGALVPLSAIASFTTVSGQPEITRENLQQVVDVTARLTGRGLGAGIADVKTALAKPGVLGPGVTYTLGGLYQQQQIAFAGLARVFAAALLAEFILLLVLYERFVWVFAIMATSLLSTTAVFTGLYVTGLELNITALMGMVMIVGIATEMAIFYVSEVPAFVRAYGAARGADCRQLQPAAADCHDHAGGNPDADAAGARSRPGCRHAAAAGSGDHCRAARAIPARSAGLAGAALAGLAAGGKARAVLIVMETISPVIEEMLWVLKAASHHNHGGRGNDRDRKFHARAGFCLR